MVMGFSMESQPHAASGSTLLPELGCDEKQPLEQNSMVWWELTSLPFH